MPCEAARGVIPEFEMSKTFVRMLSHMPFQNAKIAASPDSTAHVSTRPRIAGIGGWIAIPPRRRLAGTPSSLFLVAAEPALVLDIAHVVLEA